MLLLSPEHCIVYAIFNLYTIYTVLPLFYYYF